MLIAGDDARVLMVTSWLGSLDGKTQGGDYAASASAAGLHMLARTLAHDVREQQIIVCLVNPGNYATTPDAPMFRIPIDDAAAGMLSVATRVSRDNSGAFLDWTGIERPW